MLQANMPHRKKSRKERVAERGLERSKRTAAQQLQKLDEKLGVGVGAKKERARLLSMSA